MTNTWDNASTGAVFADPVNSELYFAENRRNRWTEHGTIKRGPHIAQYRFHAPRAGVRQDWSASGGPQGATMGQEGGTMNLLMGLVKGVSGAMAERKDDQQAQENANQQALYNAGMSMAPASQQPRPSRFPSMRRQNVQGGQVPVTPLSAPMAQINQNLSRWNQASQQQAQAQREEGIANWQGAYQEANQRAQTAGMRNQMATAMTTPAPSTSLSSPTAQINQNLSRMSQQARQAQMSTPLSSPTAQINQNLSAWNRRAQEENKQGVAMWQGSYQQAAQATQAQQWRNQMTAAMTKDVRL